MSKGSRHVTVAFAAALEALAAGVVAQRIKLLPIGEFKPRDGRQSFMVTDRAHAERIVAASLKYAGAQQIPLDYDHQSIYGAKPGVGGVAPASGWITALSAEADGIYADVQWTPRAAAAIEAREYRYVSPVVSYDTKTRVVDLIVNATLTNSPAIDDLTVLAASLNLSSLNKEPDMDLTALAASLGLPATATLDEIVAAQNAQAARTAALSTALGVAADAPPEAITAAAQALKAPKAEAALSADMMTVPKVAFDALTAQVAALSDDRFTKQVDDAIVAGKVVPAQRQTMIDWAKKDQAAFSSFIAAQPTIVTPGQTLGGRPAGEGVAALSAEQRHVAALMGLPEDKVVETVKLEAADAQRGA